MRKNPHRETDLYYDNVIVGSSVQALAAAYMHHIPIFGNVEYKPISHYYISPDIDLSSILIENKKNVYTNLSGTTTTYGMPQIELWNTLMHRLSIMGLAPMYGEYHHDFFPDLVKLPVWDDYRDLHKAKEYNTITLTVKSKIVNIHAKNIIYFDYPTFHNGVQMYMVNDHMALKNAKNLKANIVTDCVPVPQFMNTLCYETIVYKEGKSTNCCVKSIIPENNIDDWNNSQTALRLKTETMFFWNFDKKIKVLVGSREIAPILKPMYSDLEEIIILDAFAQEIL